MQINDYEQSSEGILVDAIIAIRRTKWAEPFFEQKPDGGDTSCSNEDAIMQESRVVASIVIRVWWASAKSLKPPTLTGLVKSEIEGSRSTDLAAGVIDRIV